MTKAPPLMALRAGTLASSPGSADVGVVPVPLWLVLLAPDPCMRRLLACPLEAAGYRVASVEDEAELVARMAGADRRPDLLICDAREESALAMRLDGFRWEGHAIPLLFLLPAESRVAVGEHSLALYGRPGQAFDLSNKVEDAVAEASTVEVSVA